jgi:hypothetical protein
MKHFVIPDCQIRPGDDFEFLTKIGEYIVDKQPEKIICLGDFADMASLSSYDVGKKAFEGRRYINDINATNDAMGALLKPLEEYNANARKSKHKQYSPQMTMCLGNHENRINRAINDDPKLEGVLSIDHLNYAAYGWDVHKFLDVVIIDGIAYSHYFVSGLLGRPATTAAAQLNKAHCACVAGHQQGLQIATGKSAKGHLITSIIAGSCYEHDEEYMGPQGNNHWRGALMLNDVQPTGEFDVMPLSLKYLKNR